MARPRGVWSEKRFRDALTIAVSEKDPSGLRNLRVIAEKLVDCAKAGEGWAIGMVADRLDGKPAQSLTLDANITHDLTRISDAELARIIAEGAGGERGDAPAPDPEQLH